MMIIFMLLLQQKRTNKQTLKLVIWFLQEFSRTHLFLIVTYQHHITMEKLVSHAHNLSYCSTQLLKNVLLVKLFKSIIAPHANVKKGKRSSSQPTSITFLQHRQNLSQIISKNFMRKQTNKEIILSVHAIIQVIIVILPIVSHVNPLNTLELMLKNV